MSNERTVLVLGATGGIGGELARRLVRGGWRVRAMTRTGAAIPTMETVRGDAMSEPDVVAAAEGAQVIVHAVNPPGYRKWNELVLPMIDHTIAAARKHGARIVLPGTVYNFGPDAFGHITEDSPQAPVTRKGKIRVELERRIEASGAKALIVRAGDFFGPQSTTSSWFAQLAKPGKPLRSITDPGRKGVGHMWAYLPDVAETMAQLLDREDLPVFARFHMRGQWDADGTQMIAAIRRVAGRELPVRSLPWWLLGALSPFVPLLRELREMRYLWQVPVELPNDRLVAFLGAEPHTPIDEAVRATLAGIGCLASDPAAVANAARI